MTWSIAAGLVILAIILWALARGYEVRIVLLLGAFALAALGQQAEQIVIALLQGLADSTSVVPICSAMGFAYVIRAFGCDQELVKALSRPLLYARFLVVPGTILIGFVVNIPIISQTSTSLAVGTVLIPLLRSLGLQGVVIGSALLLGASIGGELLNPGAPELVAVADKLKIKPTSLTPEVAKVVFIHLGVAMAVYLWLRRRESTVPPLSQERVESSATPSNSPLERGRTMSSPLDTGRTILWWMALVPVVPIALLFLFGPPLNLFTWPSEWLLSPKDRPELYSPRLIGVAMLVGCLVACLAVPKQAGSVAKHFFEGAGYGYTHIISLIVIAKCFSEGIKLAGIADFIAHLAEAAPVLLLPLAALLPACLAFLSGSGIGATQGLYPLLADVAIAQQIDPILVGVLCCLGAAAGRTASVVAAVTIMCSNLTETKPLELSRRVMVPLAVALTMSTVLVMLRQML
jgi:C4-dicarboxylate transporter, DcuC family